MTDVFVVSVDSGDIYLCSTLSIAQDHVEHLIDIHKNSDDKVGDLMNTFLLDDEITVGDITLTIFVEKLR